MSHYTTFSYPRGSHRITVRLEIGGQVEVTVRKSQTNEVVDRRIDQVDPRDAHRIVTDMFMVTSQLEHHGDGELRIVIGKGADHRGYAVTEYDLPARGHETTRIMQLIARDALSGYDQRSPRRQGGPRRRRMSVGASVGWALAFGVGFVAANVIGKFGMLVGALTGPFALAVSNTIALLLMSGSYYGIGQKFGEEYRGNANVWIPATLGTLPFLYGYVSLGGAATVFAIVFAAVMPFVAHMGDKSGY